MKLVFYSGGQQRSNHQLHSKVVALARKGSKYKALKLTYIPFCADGAETFFLRIMRRYRSHGVRQFFLLNVDTGPTREEIAEAMSSDIIYLAGGNTFYFLKHLRESGMLNHLKKFVKRGGVLAGLSAGGLIMTPTVRLAADEGLGPDENEVKMKNFKSMGLVDFEFSPHYSPTRKQINAHLAYSLTTKNVVYAVQDGGGIVIEGKKISFLGKAVRFHRGKRHSIE